MALGLFVAPCHLPASDADAPLENSIGMRMLPIQGEPVRLASQLTTVEQWRTFLEATGHAWEPTHHFEQSSRHPVVGISRDDALAFCLWLTEREQSNGRLSERQQYRLPFNSEWEAASGLARSASAARQAALEDSYLWGPQWPPPSNVGNLGAEEIPGYADPYPHTSPVDRFPANAQGLHDMVGNAWEWMMDQGPGGLADLRGGSWADFNPSVLRAYYRYPVPGRLRSPTIGFRVALDDLDRTQQMLAAGREAAQMEARQHGAGVAGAPATSQPGDVSDVLQRILGQETEEGAGSPPGTTQGADAGSPGSGTAWRNSLGTTLVSVTGVEPLVASHEVRVVEFLEFIRDTGRPWPGRPGFPQDADHAAAGMTAEAAEAFCDWLTRRERDSGLLTVSQRYRLPTDEEWTVFAGGERETGGHPAARAAAGGPITYFGTIWPPPFGSGNFEAMRIEGYRDRFNFTAPVRSFRPNARQLYDIEGNVAEWVADTWEPGNPDRVARGASWLTHRRDEFAISHRRRIPADRSEEDIGFRYVLEGPASP